MIFFILIVMLLLLIIIKIWKMRRMLILSIKIGNKYLPLPIIGHGLMFLGTGEDRMNTWQNLGREAIKSENGLTSMWLGSQLYALTCDPIIAGVVCRSSLGKTELAEIGRHLMGNGSIFAPVNIWMPRRKFLAPTFLPKHLNCFIEIFAEQSMVMVNCLKSRAGNGTFSIWNHITSYTMDSICQTALGLEMNIQIQTWHPFLTAFDEYSKLVSARVLQPWLYWDFLYKLLPVYQEAETKRKIIHDFVDGAIRKHKLLLQNDFHKDLNPPIKNKALVKTFLDLLLKSSGGSEGYSDLEIREELLVLMLAGTDTSAVGASFTTVMLSRHPRVQEQAYKEVREIFGDSNRPVTLEDLSRLKYIDAVIRETLRLYPPVPVILRKNDKDVKLSSEITLPAGSCTCINIWGLHRNTKYWGADAEEFIPERFLNESITPVSAYMPFSYGPRNCLGYKYAIMSMKVAITTLLRHYKVLPPSDLSAEELKKPLRLEYSIMMKHIDNFKVRLEHKN